MKNEQPTIPYEERITRSQGLSMIATALFIDLLPMLAILAVVFGLFFTFGDSFMNDLKMYEQGKKISKDNEGSYSVEEIAGGASVQSVAAFSAGAKIFGIGGVMLFIGPFLYSVASFIVTLFGFLILGVWFWSKGVHIFSFSKTKRIFINLASLAIESVPVLNLLPGVTFMTWRHVKMTQAEDKIKNKELREKALRVVQGSRGQKRYA